MNSKKKLIMVCMMISLVFSALVACSDNSSTTNQGSNKSQNDQAISKSPTSDEPVEITMFVDASWYPFQEWSGEIPEMITKATGVKPKVTVATDDKQLALMVASGDMPDLVVSFNFKLMSDSNVSMPYNEIFPQYAPNVTFDPVKELVNTVSDGNYYAIRNDFSTEAEWKANPYAHMMVPGLVVRKDILEELGNPSLASLDDLDKLFAMVKEKYPDMVPLILNPNWQRPYFDAQFGASGGFVDVDGKLEYYIGQENVKQSLLYMNSLYLNGFISSENYAYKNESETEQMMLNGQGFAYTWTYSGADRLNPTASAKGMEFMQVAEPLSADTAIYSTGTGGLGMYVTRSNKHVEKTVKFLEYLFSKEGWELAQWGVEGKDWTMNAAGYPEFTYNPQDLEVIKQKGVYWWGVPTETGVGMALSSFKEGSETTRQGEYYSKLIQFNPAIGMIQPETDSEEQIIMTNLDNMIKTEIIKVYLADSEQEAITAYEEILNKAEQIGMSKLEQWATEQYGPLKEQYNAITK